MRYLTILLALLSSFSVAQQCDLQASNAQDYVDMGNGFVQQSGTQLIWQRCNLGETWTGNNCSGSAQKLTFMHAAIEARRMSETTGEKWRVPTNEELQSLISSSCTLPAIDARYFPTTKNAQYWSSERFSFFAHVVSFDFGYTYSTQMKNPKYTRLVRNQ